MADENKNESRGEPGGLEGLIDQMSKLPQALEELGSRISGLEERESQRGSSSSPSGSASFSLEPLGKAIESMTREFTATIRELAGGGRNSPSPPSPEETSDRRRRESTAEKPPPPPSPEPPPPEPTPTPAASRVRDFLGTPSLR